MFTRRFYIFLLFLLLQLASNSLCTLSYRIHHHHRHRHHRQPKLLLAASTAAEVAIGEEKDWSKAMAPHGTRNFFDFFGGTSGKNDGNDDKRKEALLKYNLQ
jgi:hypothetical protein